MKLVFQTNGTVSAKSLWWEWVRRLGGRGAMWEQCFRGGERKWEESERKAGPKEV